MILDNIFVDIGLIIIVASVFGFIAKLLKQPLVPAYVLTGLILGPMMHVITNQSIIATLSELGIAFLLFIVGLEIDFSKLKSVGMVSILGGLAKSLILFTIGLVIVIFAGFSSLEAIYIGIIITFSSTMVVIKILSDKREMETLHTRIVIGFLLLEDIVAIIVIAILGSINDFSVMLLVIQLFKALLLFGTAYIAHKAIFPLIFKFAAKSRELLFLSALSTCFLFSLFFASLSFSISIGAFVAGVILANLPYGYEIIGRVKSIRDFFSIIFFVSLGISIVKINQNHLFVTILLMAVVLILKPFITYLITLFFGYKRRPAFLTAVSMAQTSEFSLIIATQGLLLGHISQEIFSMTAIIAILTMTATSYYINYEYTLYGFFNKFLRKFDRLGATRKEDDVVAEKVKYDVLLVGYDRIGYSIVKKLHILKKELLIVDFNPEIIKKLHRQKIHCIYGDVGDIEILSRIKLDKLSMAISTSPDKRDNKQLIDQVKKVNKKAMVFVTAYKVEDALQLYDSGADYVIVPHFLGGDHVSLLIEQFGNDMDKLLEHKLDHISELRNRQVLGHKHRAHHHPAVE